jgi:hypothetical protein
MVMQMLCANCNELYEECCCIFCVTCNEIQESVNKDGLCESCEQLAREEKEENKMDVD